jgi:hypothetical protein
MKESDKRFIEYWSKKREQGAIKFSIITGITYGIFVVVFSKVFAWNFSFTQKDIGYGILSLLIGISVLGPFMWWHRERKYHKLIEQNQKNGKKSKKKRKK